MSEPGASIPSGGCRSWVFGDNLNTDVLHPPRYFSLDPKIVKSGLFKGIDPELGDRVRPGDIIVAGKNFGCGSSRETSIQSLKSNGIAAIIAIDFARIFFRSATNNGIPCLTFVDERDLSAFRHGADAVVHFADDAVETGGRRIQLRPSSAFVRKIWSKGGLLGLLP
ncbi:MAG TPA: hypothetical protein VNW92_19385 [Polyangiaceae bacterium]|jgi:3-isopropylmalate/(R)-2-methylmalate dehydratase small subunit|nr:hypothetical protein [Polyangiaceae bacterium]